MNYLDILDQVRAHVSSLFHTKKDERLIYHNQTHTEQVVKAVVKIASHYQLSDHDFFIVNVAAWFHDVGYLINCQSHEERGAALAKEFLSSKGVEPAITDLVTNCILATKMPQHPVGLLEEIVCDADLFHLGGENFKERNKLMRKEAMAFTGKEIDKNEWRSKTIILFESHHYHTDYCQDLLSAKKEMNLNELKEKLEKDNHQEKEKEEENIDPVALVTSKKEDKVAKKEDKKKSNRPDKGIETMFRITAGNHQRLSDMADNKAHIMISTNSIILSVILSILLRKLEDNPHLIIPTLLLLIICVVTMVFSILATRPTVPPGTFTAQDVHDKKVNLLFFGNFYRMTLPDYTAGMEEMMEDRDFLYGSLIRDLYSQGVVLGRKYRLLRIAYNVFMFGIIASVLAFVIAIAVVAI
ncbi:Pycsar system effector family protein [Pedobacter cryoconitis]|uniref:Putative metal-dependent HD superfamily phosphohydrolase n=1 Tax=Pedobacter cryoconitis TaxID=188932 RepID=A0A7X0IZ56_9SPHI|nr:Pycsar system effector family protein [Pedobacter cryoconitis]MBB6498134.1 putative metal-dependent HD superfamily phosphohydrolase [Pedobacter cryoconitis]